MAYSGNKGLTRIIKAGKYSWQGFKAAFQHEEAFRQELLIAVILIPVALLIEGSGTDKALLIGSVVLLLIVEILNSAIEAVVDRFGEELHELSGRAKDMASAAVLLAIVNLVITWLLVLVY